MSFRTDPANDLRVIQEQISDLAFRLWTARGRPAHSPDVDWFVAEDLVVEYRQASPFDEFLREAIKALNSTPIVRGVCNDAEHVRIIEERRFLIDIVDRVEMVAFAYSRLMTLSRLYRKSEALIDAVKHVTSEQPLTWEVPDEIVCQRDHRALEARVLVSFVYYELTSLAHMLEGLKVPIPQGELQYLVKARDKFLAHPRLGGRVRNAHGTMSIPQVGLLHPYAINVDETDPILLDYYRSSFATNNTVDEERFRAENEKLILSSKRNDQFSTEEQLRLKAFGIREPDLEASTAEMARLLLTFALSEVQRISSKPIPSRH